MKIRKDISNMWCAQKIDWLLFEDEVEVASFIAGEGAVKRARSKLTLSARSTRSQTIALAYVRRKLLRLMKNESNCRENRVFSLAVLTSFMLHPLGRELPEASKVSQKYHW